MGHSLLCLPTLPLKPTYGGKSPQSCGDRVALLWVSKLGLWVIQMIVSMAAYAYGCFVCMLSVYRVHTELVGSRKGCQIPWDWSYTWLWVALWVPGFESPHLLEKATSTLAVESSSGITPFLLPPRKKTFLREKAHDFCCLLVVEMRKIHFRLGVLKLNSALWFLGWTLTPSGFSLKNSDALASPSLWQVTKSMWLLSQSLGAFFSKPLYPHVSLAPWWPLMSEEGEWFLWSNTHS